MKSPSLLREKYGDVFVLSFPDGLVIPWKPLNIGDYLKYEALFNVGQYTPAYLENEIFCKSVTDEEITDDIDNLKAGIVSSVAHMVMSHSGPQGIEELNMLMDYNRQIASGIIHEMVSLICQGFPAYKPEEVYDLDYPTLLLRFAQAESKLLRLGFISEPLTFQLDNQPQNIPSKPKVDSSKLLEEFYQQQYESPSKPRQVRSQKSASKTVITKDDIMESELAYTGHEKEDKVLLEHEMLEETAHIYQNYIDQMREGKKVEILSHEEKLAAAKARAKENEQRHLRARAEKRKKAAKNR